MIDCRDSSEEQSFCNFNGESTHQPGMITIKLQEIWRGHDIVGRGRRPSTFLLNVELGQTVAIADL